VVLSELYVGTALATTAMGTLLPILRDAGELRTRLGTFLMAAGSVGEFGPILLVTLMLSAQSTIHDALILLAFVAVAVMIALFTVRSSARTVPVLGRTLETSAQLAVRWAVVLIFALALLAFRLGLDLLLGGFAAGMITRALLKNQEMPAFDSKLTAVGFGIFVPFFFVVSGMKLDVAALFASPGGVAKLALFFVLFLVVRRPAGVAALPERPRDAGADGARLPLLTPAADRGRDHRPRYQQRSHACLDRGGAGGRRDPLDAGLPARRPQDQARRARAGAAGGDRRHLYRRGGRLERDRRRAKRASAVARTEASRSRSLSSLSPTSRNTRLVARIRPSPMSEKPTSWPASLEKIPAHTAPARTMQAAPPNAAMRVRLGMARLAR
jgi:hypothetical protein